MNILVLMGAPRKSGNTNETVRYFEKHYRTIGKADWEYLYPGDILKDFCTGCHQCIFKGESCCHHYESVTVIEDKILASDALVPAAPGILSADYAFFSGKDACK